MEKKFVLRRIAISSVLALAMLFTTCGSVFAEDLEDTNSEITSTPPVPASTITETQFGDRLELYQENSQDSLNTEAINTDKPISDPARRIVDAVKDEWFTVNTESWNATYDEMDAYMKEAMIADRTAFISSGFYSYELYRINGSIQLLLYYREHPFRETEECFARYTQLEDATKAALQWVNNDMTDQEKVLAIHDYLVLNAEYDTVACNECCNANNVDSWTAYGILVNKKGVCDAYTRATEYLLSYLDIPCIRISSSAMNHAWNLVQLDGQWYHLDVTWDDPIPNRDGITRYLYCLQNDTGISKLSHYSWDSDGIISTDTRYEAMPRGNNTNQICYYNNWYQSNHTKTDFYGGNSESWEGLIFLSTQLYPQNQSIIKKDLKTGGEETLYTLTDAEKGIQNPENAQITEIAFEDNGILEYRYKNGAGKSNTGEYDLYYSDFPLKKLELSRTEITLNVGSTSTLYVMGDPAGYFVLNQAQWISNDEEIATVEDGIITAVAPGKAEISVTVDGKTVVCTVEVVSPYNLGDVNADTQINASDALQDLRHSVKEIFLEGQDFTRGDVDRNNVINASDALQILRYSVKEITSF